VINATFSGEMKGKGNNFFEDKEKNSSSPFPVEINALLRPLSF